MRSFGRPAARFIAIRSSRPATCTDHAEGVGPDRAPQQRLVVEAGVRGREQVEVAVTGGEGEQPTGSQCPRVQRRHPRGVVREAAADRLTRARTRSRAPRVLAVTGVADIEVVRDRRRSMGLCGQATDEDEPHTLRAEETKEPGRIESRPLAHSATSLKSRQNSTMLRSSAIPASRLSPGVRSSRCRIWLRSMPMPSRGIDSRPKPQASSNRSSVLTRGSARPRSIRAMVSCGIPAAADS